MSLDAMNPRRSCSRAILIASLIGLLTPLPPAAQAASSLELIGTFHAMGIVLTLDAGLDPDQDATAVPEYRRRGEGEFRPGLPLARVAPDRFVGSLFWLEPGAAYETRVPIRDPGGGSADGMLLQGEASTRAEISLPNPTHSYFVSPEGNGTTCSQASPCSLAQGLNSAAPGEEVVLRGGVYYQGEMALARSGLPGKPIVIRGESGEAPTSLFGPAEERGIFDALAAEGPRSEAEGEPGQGGPRSRRRPGGLPPAGARRPAGQPAVFGGADPATFAWTAQGGGVYRTTVQVPDTHLVAVNGERLYPYPTLRDLQILAWDLPGFYASGAELYVRLAQDANPNGLPMVVSRFNHAFTIRQSFIVFANLTFRHYGQGDYAKALYFDGASDNLVQGSTFTLNDLGIGVKRDSHRNVFQANQFSDSIFLWPWDAVKAGSGLETGGIRVYDPMTGRGNIIRRNVFHDYFDGFAVCSDVPALTSETDVYENLVYRVGDDGMETDGECSNVRIWGNVFHDVLIGISLAPVYTGPVYAIRNLIYRTGAGNNDYSGSPFKFNSGYGLSGPMFLLHNTADAVQPDTNGLAIMQPGTWTMITARNNIWAGTAYALSNANTGQPVNLDYDDLWTTRTGDLVRWGATRYRDLPAFAAATGQETHGLSVAPGFLDPAAGVYRLSPGSALIDRALRLAGINDAYAGSGPDLGAFEYSASTFADVPSDHWAYADIEKLFQGGFIAGCQDTPQRKYCPEASLTRAEAAVFVERGLHGGGFLPPTPASTPFADVPLAEWFAKWVRALWDDGFTAGCGTAPPIFCPLSVHGRAEATVFFLRMLRGKDYVPPEPGSLPYADVEPGTWYAKWVAAARAAGLTAECEDLANRADNRFRPERAITRAEAGCMMVRAKGLSP